jgi:hypothetical protein
MVAAHRLLRSVTSGAMTPPTWTPAAPWDPSVPHGCIVGSGSPGGPEAADRRSELVDVRIGIVQSIKELEVELGDDAERDAVIADIEAALSKAEGVLWLTDRRGRRVAVPVAKVAYIEVGAPVSDRRVGFGAP